MQNHFVYQKNTLQRFVKKAKANYNLSAMNFANTKVRQKTVPGNDLEKILVA